MKRISLFFQILIFTMILLVACGPATQVSETQIGSAGSAATDAIGADGTNADNNEAEVEETGANAAAAPADEEAEAASASSGTAVDPASVEQDAAGIEVGFTEEGRPYRGSSDAAIVLREFSDYQCPFCARFAQETMPGLLQNQIANGEVRLVFYDFPLTSIHPQAVAAANAARCAGAQGAAAYWEMHDALFRNVGEWSNNQAETVFSRYAGEIGLDLAQFDACQEEDRYHDVIQTDLEFGQVQGVRSTPTFFVNDQMLIGAQPLGAFNEAIALVQSGETLPPTPAPAPTAQPGPAIAPTPATIATGDIAGAMGDPNAPITIVEFTDYQCPFCVRHATQTLPQIVSNMVETGRVYYVLKDFPLDNIHPEARAAAVAARCAGEQEAYWEMHDELFATQQRWSGQGAAAGEIFVTLAEELGLDVESFSTCLSSGRYDQTIEGNLQEGASLGVRGTPAFFIDGYPVSGAQPYDLFDFAVGLAEEGTLGDAYVRQEETQPTPVPTPSGPVSVDTDGSYAVGDPDAPVTIIEFTDFQCPFCVRHFAQTYPQIKENYIDQGLVYYVFKDFPLTSIHPQAVKAAEAARCAGDQGAYLEMHGKLFTEQQQWSGRGNVAEVFGGYAVELGLDAETFSACLEDSTHEAAVMADLQEGADLGIRGTPGFFINGYLLSGAQPYSTFEQAIESFLNEQ